MRRIGFQYMLRTKGERTMELKPEMYRGKKIIFLKNSLDGRTYVNAVWQNRKKDLPDDQYHTYFNSRVTGDTKSQAFGYARKFIDELLRK